MTVIDVSEALATQTFLTFAGTETYLQYIQGYALREFCAFEVATDEAAFQDMQRGLLAPVAQAAADQGLGLLADCLVWRASQDYITRLGHGAKGVEGVNQAAVARMRKFVSEWRASNAAARACTVIVTGDLGPRGDGYALDGVNAVSVEAARDYHTPQVDALVAAGIDLLMPLTMTNLGETLGIVHAAERAGIPVLVSATVETDGRLPDGMTIADYVRAIDDVTQAYPVGYIINCAHPDHLERTLDAAANSDESWLKRLYGLRANASTRSHAELDDSPTLERGNPHHLAQRMAQLQENHGFTIVGGCCGTDAEHLREIAKACA